MFNLDFKPQYYSYPLNTEEYSKIKLRNREIEMQIGKLQTELQEIGQCANAESYRHYRLRIVDKVKIMREELKEYAQIFDCHQNIDANLKNSRKNSVEIKNKMLQHYKVQSLAKQYKKITEKMREREMQKQLLQNNQRIDEEERNRNKSKKQYEKMYLQMSEDNYAYGKKYLPKINTKMVNNITNNVQNISNPQNASLNEERKMRLPRINMTQMKRTSNQRQRLQSQQKRNKSESSFFMKL